MLSPLGNVRASDVPAGGLFDFEVASSFYDLARLLLITGANEHRANAYYKAALTLDGYEKRIWRIASEGRLESIPGIGRGLAARTLELFERGSLEVLEDLRKQVPSWLLYMADVRGIGWRTLASVHALGARTPDQALSLLPRSPLGMRLRTQARHAIEQVGDAREPVSMQLAHADLIANELLDWIAPAVNRAEIAGSLRRRDESLIEIRLVVTCPNENVLRRRLASFRLVRTVEVTPHEILAWTTFEIPVRVQLAISTSDYCWQLFLATGNGAHHRTNLPNG